MPKKILKKKKSAPSSSTSSAEAGAKSTQSGWFNKGFDAVHKEQERSEQNKNYLQDFWLIDGQSSKIRLLDSEPISIHQHRLKNNKGWVINRTCINPQGNPSLEACPMCERGLQRQFVGVFLLVERERTWFNKKKNIQQVDKNVIKLWRPGKRILGALDVIKQEKGTLTGYDLKVTRTGKGTDSQYTILPLDRSPLGLPQDKMDKLEEIDILEILKPKTRRELLLELGSKRAEQEYAEQDGSSTEDEEIIKNF